MACVSMLSLEDNVQLSLSLRSAVKHEHDLSIMCQ